MPPATSLVSRLIPWPSFFSSATSHTGFRSHPISRHFCLTQTSKNLSFTNSSPPKLPKKSRRRDSPENTLRHQLDICSKHGDLPEALRLYDSARADSTPLSLHHYNLLLHLSSHNPSDANRAMEIFRQMRIDGVNPNETTFTALVRVAASCGDPELGFEFIKKMSAAGIKPRNRSYRPSLLGFCEKGDFEKAREIEAHMVEAGVDAEEIELAALFRVNSELGRGEDVYRLLQRMRAELRIVSGRTAGFIEDWFHSDPAEGFGAKDWDLDKVNEGVVRGGGGWHGEGWLGEGKWSVGRSEMDDEGVCSRCGDRLMCVDIDPVETEVFARSLAELASRKEGKADFAGFQAWLDRYGPFDAVIDGANVGLNSQHKFSFFQLNYTVNGLRQMSLSEKLPLVVLHCNRVRGKPADNPNNKRLLDSWRKAGALYATPPGSNDDWYWLYAAVHCKCLVVTNDEMRDHLFALLGNSFFPRWKEKHQVRLTVSKNGPTFHMPPPYSIVIQESARGSWHIPTVKGDNMETPRQWICANRAHSSPVFISSPISPDVDVTREAISCIV